MTPEIEQRVRDRSEKKSLYHFFRDKAIESGRWAY